MNQKKFLYIVRFVSYNQVEKFIKIGVTSNSVDKRFSSDVKNYTFEIIYTTDFYDFRDSFIVESNFHELLKRFKYRPKLPLSSGNTECFTDIPEFFEEVLRIVSSKPTHSERKIIPRFTRRKRSDPKKQTLTELIISGNLKEARKRTNSSIVRITGKNLSKSKHKRRANSPISCSSRSFVADSNFEINPLALRIGEWIIANPINEYIPLMKAAVNRILSKLDMTTEQLTRWNILRDANNRRINKFHLRSQ